MYKIIGADGGQYGPVTAEIIRDWIANNRANGQTLVKAEGAGEWQPLSTFPEFAEALTSRPLPAVQSWPESGPVPVLPPLPAPDADALAEEILRRDQPLDIGSCFGRAWEKLSGDFWPIVGISALIGLIAAAVNYAVLGIVLNGPLHGGICWYYLKQVRGEKPMINDAFAGFTLAFVQLLLFSLVSMLLVSLGLLLCVIPGIYLGVAWCLAAPLVIDKRLQFWDAMEVSRKVITKRWWSFFGLLFLTLLLNLAGALACGVGVFITAPWSGLALMYAYEDILGTPRSPLI